MFCQVARCGKHAVAVVWKNIVPLDLCEEHGERYRKEYRKHFSPMVDLLSQKWMVQWSAASGRLTDVAEALRQCGAPSFVVSWQSSWLQMVEAEVLNDGHDQVGVKPPSVSSYSKPGKPLALPEHATRAGQAAIARRRTEDDELEKKLQADATEYQRGRRMELELELRTKRRVAARKEAVRET